MFMIMEPGMLLTSLCKPDEPEWHSMALRSKEAQTSVFKPHNHTWKLSFSTKIYKDQADAFVSQSTSIYCVPLECVVVDETVFVSKWVLCFENRNLISFSSKHFPSAFPICPFLWMTNRIAPAKAACKSQAEALRGKMTHLHLTSKPLLLSEE